MMILFWVPVESDIWIQPDGGSALKLDAAEDFIQPGLPYAPRQLRIVQRYAVIISVGLSPRRAEAALMREARRLGSFNEAFRLMRGEIVWYLDILTGKAHH